MRNISHVQIKNKGTDMITKTKRLSRIQTTAISLLLIAGVVNYLDRSTLSIANHSVSQDLGLSASEMGLLLSAFSFAYAFSQLPVGILLDKLGARVMLGLGMFVWSTAQFCGGLVTNLTQFVIARIALGVGEAPNFPAGMKVVSEWFGTHERGRPTGIFIASTTIGPALAPPILTALLITFGWREMFMIMGAFGIAVSIGWYIIYRDRKSVDLTHEELEYLDDKRPGMIGEQKLTMAEWRRLFLSSTTWGMIVGNAGIIYMLWLYLTWLPAYLERERHLSLADTGWLVSIPYLVGTLGMVLSGFIADALLARGASPINSRKWPICIGLLGGAAFTVPAAFTPNLVLAMTYLSLAMFFVQMACGASWALVTVIVPRHQSASLASIQNFGGYFGGSFAPFITGVVVDRTHSFVTAFLISAGIALIAAAVYALVVRKRVDSSDNERTPEVSTTTPQNS
ncbi:MFS transporter [Pseudomonas sp.]|uniref:MFS transporter n=3 Tax=Pseudomonas TaxID=286 RepID=UPI001D90A06E|nr:MFS transporter [Pseudomonas sp.]EKT4543492.1 MFS transporter [Pseudomonas putida]MBS6041000.1 MFS transporter [Pseudomonas sp.]WHL27416.1 MFS transporter [Pseudomonas juntendi]